MSTWKDPGFQQVEGAETTPGRETTLGRVCHAGHAGTEKDMSPCKSHSVKHLCCKLLEITAVRSLILGNHLSQMSS